jgi:glycine/D-amino acid oxidase-like deaminating enzyme
VDAIDTFAQQAEKPILEELLIKGQVLSLAVSAEILDARMRGVAVAVNPAGVVLSPDGTQLRIGGGDPIFFRSDDQIAAIRKLVEAFSAGTGVPINALTHHGSLRRLFGEQKWALLRPHLQTVNRLWRICP